MNAWGETACTLVTSGAEGVNREVNLSGKRTCAGRNSGESLQRRPPTGKGDLWRTETSQEAVHSQVKRTEQKEREFRGFFLLFLFGNLRMGVVR